MARLDAKTIQEARKAGKLVEHKEAVRYYRFREDFRQIPRGTVLLPKRIIWGFPHIPRIFRFKEGVERNIAGSFYIEEKIDGFNVRIAQIDGKIYAFSRGGFLDLFVTEKADTPEMKKFFQAFPGYVLCGEMVGNTPYTPPTKKFDTKLFVFDMDTGNGDYLSCSEKYWLLEKYGLDSVPVLGKFSGTKNGMRIALSLLKDRKEGMVIKSADRKKAVKFVTPYADIEDIGRNMALLFDMPQGFFLQRVLRSGIFIKDFQLSHSEYAKRLGNAFYEGLKDGLEQIEQNGQISEEFEVLINDRRIWNAIKKHTSREVKLERIFEREEKDGIRIRFRKIYKRTGKKLRDFMAGKPLVD